MITDAQYASSKAARRFARWFLLILLVAVTVMGWNWAKTQGYIDNFQQTLKRYLIDADVFGSRTRAMIAQIDSTQLETNQRMDQLAASVLSIDNQRHVVAQNNVKAINSNGQNERILEVVTHLVYSANQFLQLTGDTENAQAALKQALMWAQSSDQLVNTDIEAALAGDIQRLEVVSQLDRAKIYQEISRYAEQISPLPLAMDTHLKTFNPPEIPIEAADSNFLSKFFVEIWQDLCQLIQIKKLDSATVALLSPSQVQLLHGNVKLQLKQAQLALLTRDQDAFLYGLDTAHGLIDSYFDTRQSSVIELQTKLKQYKEMAKEMAYPELLASLQALQSTQIKSERGNK